MKPAKQSIVILGVLVGAVSMYEGGFPNWAVVGLVVIVAAVLIAVYARPKKAS